MPPREPSREPDLVRDAPSVLLFSLALPVRLAVAGVNITLAAGALLAPDGPVRRPGGYVDQLDALLGRDGMIGKLDAMSRDPQSPLGRLAALAKAADSRRPLGRAIAPGGILDRVLGDEGPLVRVLSEGGAADRILGPGGPLDRLLAPGGVLDRLLEADGPLERLVEHDGALDRVTRPGGVLDTVLAEGGLVERLLQDHGFVEKLVAEGGTLDQLVALGPILEQVQPRLLELVEVLPDLHRSVDGLGAAVGPLSDLANRIPGRKRAAG
jgi:hypothetical protein